MGGQKVSEALQALYAGDEERARAVLPEDDRLSIFEAAAFGKIDRLRAILDRDPGKVAAFSDDGFTALHLAIFGESAEAVRLLIERGADIDVLSTAEIARVPPLGTAVFVRSPFLARLLLDAGADVNGHEEGGGTPLHAAAANGDEELVALLLERGADRELVDREGKRPADLAATDEIRRLLSRS